MLSSFSSSNMNNNSYFTSGIKISVQLLHCKLQWSFKVHSVKQLQYTLKFVTLTFSNNKLNLITRTVTYMVHKLLVKMLVGYDWQHI